MKLDLRPRDGVGPIKLGIERSELRKKMHEIGIPFSSERGSMDFYQENSIQVEFEADGTASFIGIACDEKIELLYKVMDLFNLSAPEVFQVIAEFEKDDHPYNENEYIFPDQIITLWEADSQYDRKGNEQRVAWAEIGIGDERHLNFSTKQ